MRVNIISYEDVNAWILGKFARKLHEELTRMGVDACISNKRDDSATINHHIIYIRCNPADLRDNDTLMITHIDETEKVDLLKVQLVKARAGICMSQATVNELVGVGLPKEKLCYVSPAHDNVMKPRRLVLGITSKVQPTGSKREDMVVELASTLDPALFEFVIMGAGWERIIRKIRSFGIQCTYYDAFDYDQYTQIVPAFDYYLYPGQDEGSMGFIDALASGVKTVVTPQGFHLDAPGGISYPFNTQKELEAIFAYIGSERRQLIDSVKSWTWKDYAAKHLEIWRHLAGEEVKGHWPDGLNSLLHLPNIGAFDLEEYQKNLRRGSWRRFVSVNMDRLGKMRNPAFVIRKILERLNRRKG